jgi:hypothetical protein
LENCPLGKFTFGKLPFRILSLGKSLGKYLTSSEGLEDKMEDALFLNMLNIF